jgi:hypothetical protein
VAGPAIVLEKADRAGAVGSVWAAGCCVGRRPVWWQTSTHRRCTWRTGQLTAVLRRGSRCFVQLAANEDVLLGCAAETGQKATKL